MPSSERAQCHNVHIVLHRLKCRFRRGLEQWPEIHIEAHVGICRRHHPCSPVMPVLTDLRDQDPRTPPFQSFEFCDLPSHGLNLVVVAELPDVDTRDGTDFGPRTDRTRFSSASEISPSVARSPRPAPPAPAGWHRRARPRSSAASAARHRSSLRASRTAFNRATWDSRTAWSLTLQTSRSPPAPTGTCSPPPSSRSRVDPRLPPRRCLLDPQLGQARLNRLGHAAGLLDLLDVRPRLADQRSVRASTQ